MDFKRVHIYGGGRMFLMILYAVIASVCGGSIFRKRICFCDLFADLVYIKLNYLL